MVTRKGRPPKFVNDPAGHPIVGLSFHKASDRYYATFSKPRVYFGKDYDVAVMRFCAWQEKQEGGALAAVKVKRFPARVRMPEELTSDAITQRLSSGESIDAVLEDLSGRYQLMPSEGLYAWARKEIVANPARFAERVGVPEIGYLQELKPPEPSLRLEEVVGSYVKGKKKISREWGRKTRRYWKEFVAQLAVTTLREVEMADVERYHDWIWGEAERQGLSPTWVNHRLSTVRTVLRYALKKKRDLPNVRRVLDMTEVFERQERRRVDPQPIGPTHFQKLLNVSDAKWRAIFLLALNACMYPSEVADVKKREIDLTKRTLVTKRGKTGIIRAAILWDRTVQAIQEYQEAEPHDGDHLFLNAQGAPYNENHVGRNFRRRRAKAGLPESLEFAMIRDGAYTAAVEAGCNMQTMRLVAGHANGISDYYVRRSPKMVADACQAIERHYFGVEQG